MEGLQGPVILFALLIIISFWIPYIVARQRTKEYQRGKRKFQSLSDSLGPLEGHISEETDRWPMYARPVIFTDIDHKAQVDFAKAQQALESAHEILPVINSIEETESPKLLKRIAFFNLPKNLQAISLGASVIEYRNAFAQEILNLEFSLKSLRTSRRQIEKQKNQIEKSIIDLQRRAEKINAKLKPLDVWRAIEVHNLSWLVINADSCQLEAVNCIQTGSDDEYGYMEHARANVFVSIGNISLDCIELFIESENISRRYELDKFQELFDKSINVLQSVLEMDEVWSSWRKLKKIKPSIDNLPIARSEAEKSLRSFKHRQDQFEKLIGLIGEVDIENEIEYVKLLEKDCEAYWYSFAERKTYWEEALGIPAKLPSTELNAFRAILVAEINPEISVDMVIKQSRLLDLMGKIGRAIEWHNSITDLIFRLEAELRTHKEAEKEVNRLLAPNGDATLLRHEITSILNDTSPDIADWGKILVNYYINYSDRAENIQGADFPQLVISLNHFINESRKLVEAHHFQLRKLEENYDSLYDYIDSINYDLQAYITYTPRFEKDLLALFGEYFNESSELLTQKKVENYSSLRRAVTAMQTWIENTEKLIEPSRQKYEDFEKDSTRAGELLQHTKEVIKAKKADVIETWSWGKKGILPRVNTIARAFDRKKKDWEGLVDRNWSGYNITRALSYCRDIITFCERKLSELDRISDRIRQKQEFLDGSLADIERLLHEDPYGLTPQDRKRIASLIKIAKETLNFDNAVKVLNYAHSLAVKKVSSKAEREIQNIIIKSEGPVFTGNVINTGNISGAFKMVQYSGQKRRRHNGKKK